MNTNNSKKLRISKKAIIISAVVVLAIAVVVVGLVLVLGSGSSSNKNLIYTYTTEAGTPISPSVYSLDETQVVRFGGDVDIDSLVCKVGSHKIKIVVDGVSYNVTLVVKDSVAPTATPVNVVYKMNTVPSAADFVTDVEDFTSVSFAFVHSPNMGVQGKQNVTVKLTDEGGNSTTYNSIVYVTQENVVPEWELGTAFPEVNNKSGSNITFAYVDISFAKNIKSPGVFPVALRALIGSKYETFYTKLVVKDTTAPNVTVVSGGLYDINEKLPEASYWVTEYLDATIVTFSYAIEYSITVPGTYYLEVKATDEGGNVTSTNVKINAFDSKNSNNAPIITVTDQLTISVGQTIDFKNHIKIFDDKDGDIDITDTQKVLIDSSTLNTYLPGKYRVLITATDSTGQSSSAALSITVEHANLSDAEINTLFDQIISEIIKPGMTKEQKVYAVYNKIIKNDKMNFNGSSDKTNDPVREAYYGFTNNYGDSYTVSCMTKCLLEKLGFEVMTVTRISSVSSFYWNLVDFGNGWFHVDPYPKSEPWIVGGKEKEFFKLTDKELDDYTLWHENNVERGVDYYLFDKLLYPDTPVPSNIGYIYNPYLVLYLTTEGGYIDGQVSQNVKHGSSSSSVIAIPSAGYKFVGWSDGVTTAERKDLVKDNLTVTAYFEEDPNGLFKKYNIKYIAETGGTIVGAATQFVDSGHYGSTVIAVPDPGYKFIGWSDGVTTEDRKDLAKEDMTVIAYFDVYEGTSYTVEYKAGEGGTIDGKTFQILEKGDKSSSVTAVADEGYVFNCWSDGVTTATRSDKPTENMSVTAYFVKVGAEVFTIKYEAGIGGTIVGSLVQRVEAEISTEKVIAIAQRGYKFVAWSDGLTNPERTDIATEDTTFTAIFEALPEINVIYNVGEGGYLNGETTQLIYLGETTTAVTVYAKTGYRFIGWSDGSTVIERTDTPEADFEVTALFELIPTFEVKYLAGVGGSITGESTQYVVVDGTTTKVTAIASRGFKFVSWSDGVLTAERTDVVTSDLEITAQFEALPSYTITYSCNAGGVINGTLSQTMYEGESYDAVFAIPNEGYAFESWSDGVTTAKRTDVATMDRDVVAIFRPERVCTITYAAGVGGMIEGPDGATSQTIFIGQTTIEVTAVALEGYVFVSWSDGNTNATRSDVAHDEILVLTAIFEALTLPDPTIPPETQEPDPTLPPATPDPTPDYGLNDDETPPDLFP